MKFKENWHKVKFERNILDPEVDQRLWKGISNRIEKENRKRKISWYSVAASVVLLFGIGFGLWASFEGDSFTSGKVFANSSTSAPKEVVLEDGSKVTLQPGSTLMLSKTFGKDAREVAFVGEAFFSISKDKERPFRIKGNEFEVTVLGTEFQLNSTKKDQRVELLEGSVRIDKEGKEIVLKPLESWAYTKKGSVQYFNSGAVQSFAFDGLPFQKVIEDIEKTYQVRVAYPKKFAREPIYGELSGTLEELLGQLSFLYDLELNKISKNHYEIK